MNQKAAWTGSPQSSWLSSSSSNEVALVLLLTFLVNSLRCFLPHRRVFLFSLPNNGPFLHPTRPSFHPSARHPLLIHTSSLQQLPTRNRTTGISKAKGDENATSKHLRQGSGAGVGPSRSTTFGKSIRERPVLNEVTKTAINRKVGSSSYSSMASADVP